jgi:hypothetical protein
VISGAWGNFVKKLFYLKGMGCCIWWFFVKDRINQTDQTDSIHQTDQRNPIDQIDGPHQADLIDTMDPILLNMKVSARFKGAISPVGVCNRHF